MRRNRALSPRHGLLGGGGQDKLDPVAQQRQLEEQMKVVKELQEEVSTKLQATECKGSSGGVAVSGNLQLL